MGASRLRDLVGVFAVVPVAGAGQDGVDCVTEPDVLSFNDVERLVGLTVEQQDARFDVRRLQREDLLREHERLFPRSLK